MSAGQIRTVSGLMVIVDLQLERSPPALPVFLGADLSLLVSVQTHTGNTMGGSSTQALVPPGSP